MMRMIHIYTNASDCYPIETLSCTEGCTIQKHCIDGKKNRDFNYEDGGLILIEQPEQITDLWDMVQQAEKQFEPVVFLLVLKEADFSLAYEAGKYDSVYLLMGSLGEEEWNLRIGKCKERLSYRKRVRMERTRLEEYEYEKNNTIMSRLLSNIIEKPGEMEFLLPEINKRYDTNFGAGSYEVFLLLVNRYELCKQTSRFIKEMTLLAIRSLTFAKEMVISYREPYGLIGIVHYERKNSREERKEAYTRLYHNMHTLQKRYGDFQMILAVGSEGDSISTVPDSLQEATLARAYATPEEPMVFAYEIRNLNQGLERYLPERKRKELIRHITLGDVRRVNGWFLDFHQKIEPEFMQYPPAFSLMCSQVFDDLTEQEKIGKEDLFPEWKFFYLQHIFDLQEKMRELELLLLEICHIMAGGLGDDQEVAVRAIAYMKVHYKEPINLEFIAEKCGLSTSYFSRKFKEQTGENYIDVLTDIRIREAQRLLGTTNMPIGEIVREVGYCDDKHFRKLFVHVTGVKPMEYRKKLRKDMDQR